ncbi:SGNH/GDSL hydrolase family protein [Tunturiibacter gelidoferens]|uniref:Lysophospholipase L1-like esterase n=1 Tax=Tunturiibacter gelidiferens TaxID=3069689 RepID=A0ACC5P1G6_9BACT|nr:SGNH/GDSL hydrolase family protein [Edaphobacter lichenicola]MBB5340696.1 lysophospholipase L1-like esterase [Edaphobacter lichenicola]
MHWKPKGWTLIGMLLLAVPGAMTVMKVAAAAQATTPSTIATTQVTDTIYRGDGTLANGSVIVSWQAFTAASGQAVPSGTTSATITNGALSLALVPNAGSTPIGTYYTAVYHLDDGSVSREFWVIPVSQAPVQVSTIKSTVLPTSVAMQTVSKNYVDTAIAAAVTGHPLDSSNPFVEKAGDTMTGPLVLPGDPTVTTQAADKHYVDVSVAGVAAGLGQKVSTLPAATQAVAQPIGTQLQVNNLNGDEYASQYVSGLGGNGIANAVTSPDCASGCDVKVEHSYGGENYTATTLNSGAGGTHIEDNRNGARRDTYMNPTSSLGGGADAGQVIDVTSTRSSQAEVAAGGSSDPSSYGLQIRHQGLTGGSNLFPEAIGSVPYFKTNYNAMNVAGSYSTMGQHILDAQTIDCYGVGDCLIGSQFINSSGGFRDEADEGAHPFDIQIQEDFNVFQGVCSAGCSPGSTVVTAGSVLAGGTQGEGRFLIDKNPAKTISTGVITGGTGQVNSGPGPGATFSGTNFPVSVFLATAATIPSQANNAAPGPVTIAIATTGVTTGFATNTAAVASPNGVACLTDSPADGGPTNYEMANYSVVDGTHLKLTLNKPHQAGATIAFGGLCGYGLEQTVDTVGAIRQVFPVIGSYSTTGLYYAGGLTSLVAGQGTGSGYLNVTMQIAAIARNNGVVTVTTAGSLPVDVNGLSMNISGVADQSYNGNFVVTTTGPDALTFAQAGANSTSTGGNVSKLTGGYVLYPMAEVLGVFDTATKSVDGQLTLAPNTVSWAVNDALEEPHYYQQRVSGDVEFIGQTTPRPTLAQTAGVEYEGNVGPGLSGWTVTNAVPASSYLGNGGTHTVPGFAYAAQGIWQRTMDVQAGEQSVFSVHCNSHGCGRWNSGYDLFELDSNVGVDSISFQPTTSTLQMNLRGSSYQFSPQAFTAGTINAGTVNATTLNGSVGAAQLPLFGASGTSHSRGAVPDPGTTAGTTRYLREDGTWSVPAGAGGSGGQSVGAGLSGGAAPIPGATADYNFLEGTGTVVTDNSGNGNNGTLGAGALSPAWTTAGLSFSGQEQVALPPALNSSETFFMGVYLQPITTSIPGNSFPMLVGSSLGGNGLNLLYDYENNGTLSQDTYILAPTIYGSNAVFTGVQNLVSGFHVLTYVLGTPGRTADQIYIDGVESTSYDPRYHFNAAGLQTSGNLFLGSSNTGIFGSSGLNGTFYRMVTMPTNTLTAAQVQQISNQIRNDVASRGVNTSPAKIKQGTPTLHCIGDSITAGLGTTNPYCSLLSLSNQPAYSIDNWGIVGVSLQAIDASENNRVGQLCESSRGPSVALVFLGTNDFLNPVQTPTGVIPSLAGEVQTLKGAGCRVFVGTMLSRSGNDGAGGSYDADKDAYDSLILTGAKAFGADGVVDFAANPLLGADGATSNSTYFQGDAIHPTQAGQQLLANAASNALNYYFGYNQMNPHVVSAGSYTMQAGDGYITASPTANQTLTLPDCTGQSGAVYTVTNLQSAFTVGVVAGSSAQLINGLAASTVVPVPANGSLTLRDVPNPKTVSGCHWEM